MSAPSRPAHPLVSVVVPVRNEEGCVDEVAQRVAHAVREAGARLELLFVDDGSTDATPLRIAALCASDKSLKCVRLTRSFGHQAALLAGLRFATGDAIVTMDGDLQHPPELLPKLLEAWRAGADVVHTIRREPPGARIGWKRRATRLCYDVIDRLGSVSLPPDEADFRLLDRRVLVALNGLSEHFVFLRGLIPWLGFSEARVVYDEERRFSGRSQESLRHALRLTLDGILSFSVVPLRLIVLLGLVTTLAGLLYGVFAVVAQLTGHTQTGWTSLVVLVLFFGGVQILSIGVVSEYVGRTYEEAKRRPRYVIDRTEGIEER